MYTRPLDIYKKSTESARSSCTFCTTRCLNRKFKYNKKRGGRRGNEFNRREASLTELKDAERNKLIYFEVWYDGKFVLLTLFFFLQKDYFFIRVYLPRKKRSVHNFQFTVQHKNNIFVIRPIENFLCNLFVERIQRDLKGIILLESIIFFYFF